MIVNRYCMALDLVDDAAMIAEYEKYHREVWPEIKASIAGAGIEKMEIYRIMNRLFMIMEVDETFSFERKSAMDATNPKVQEWEQLMWKYQQALPVAKPGEKWLMMDKVFEL
ncbi:L-rhamnose mutarotase [Chitinophaga horti]|uniref:L-rhamnose mutarotase n=1 Tax=Chitinophaga horti TaxID=2920382 RepID=A0ABY6IVX2_9BACT|nr:L-rhamnose mutarotase [Chitinophaga horti]UYQ91523.1 L-rhamnose mutarotase [Chitinophaga horti]